MLPRLPQAAKLPCASGQSHLVGAVAQSQLCLAPCPLPPACARARAHTHIHTHTHTHRVPPPGQGTVTATHACFRCSGSLLCARGSDEPRLATLSSVLGSPCEQEGTGRFGLRAGLRGTSGGDVETGVGGRVGRGEGTWDTPAWGWCVQGKDASELGAHVLRGGAGGHAPLGWRDILRGDACEPLCTAPGAKGRACWH